MWRDGLGAGGRRGCKAKVTKGKEGPVGQRSAHRPGGVEREVRAVVPRWCSARSSAPWRGAALGCAGAAKACGAHGRPSPRRGGASVGLAREGGAAGGTSSGSNSTGAPCAEGSGKGGLPI